MLAQKFYVRNPYKHFRFERVAVPETGRGDLDFSLTKRFTVVDPTDDLLCKISLITQDENQVDRLTIAGTLLCTKDPQQWLNHAYIQAVSYTGERTDSDYQTDARDIMGPLDEQVSEAMHFVRRHMTIRAAKSTVRPDLPQFSERAVFEALVNAVAHRDYALSGSRIRLHLFRDRLELYVPGAFVNGLTPETLHLIQASRNDLIVSLLARCPALAGLGRTHLMGNRGEGVPIIQQECQDLTGRLPEYSIINNFEVRLVFPAAG